MYDLGINALAFRANHSDFAGEESGLRHLKVVGGAVAALYQQLVITTPRYHRYTATPRQQSFVWLKCVPSLFTAEIGFPNERVIIGFNPECNLGTRRAHPLRVSIFI